MLLLVHAGAGMHSLRTAPVYESLFSEILAPGYTGDCMEIATLVTRKLEEHPVTNAGISGSNTTISGNIECDACIMDSRGLLGSVAALPMTNIDPLMDMKMHGNAGEIHPSPIQIASCIASTHSRGNWSAGRVPPLIIAGIAGHEFARDCGLEMISQEQAQQLVSKQTRNRYKDHSDVLAEATMGTHANPPASRSNLEIADRLDTVGCIVIDDEGNMAVASSSGGISMKHTGRVGSAACPSFGLDILETSDSLVGVTCSGTGETIIKARLAAKLAHACSEGAMDMLGKMPENTGALVVVKNGSKVELLWPHSTPSFCIGYRINGQKPVFKISRRGKGSAIEGVFGILEVGDMNGKQ